MLTSALHLVTASLLAGCQQAPAPPEPAAAVNTPPLPVASDAAAETLLVDVRKLDPTIRLNVRYATANNFTGKPVPGYENSRALLRREAAAALARVQARLRPQGLGLLIYDGYRPVRATRAMVDWARRTGRMHLLQQGYIASRSRHNLGLAVDLTLARLGSGAELDMGTAFDTFSEAAHTANADGLILQNRQTLVQAMRREGFSNYDREWWHFSYPVGGAFPFDMVIR